MKINGIEINQVVIEAVIERMKAEAFKASELEAVAVKLGVPTREGTAMRVADRLIQREKKAGNIALSRPYWAWVGAK